MAFIAASATTTAAIPSIIVVSAAPALSPSSLVNNARATHGTTRVNMTTVAIENAPTAILLPVISSIVIVIAVINVPIVAAVDNSLKLSA